MKISVNKTEEQTLYDWKERYTRDFRVDMNAPGFVTNHKVVMHTGENKGHIKKGHIYEKVNKCLAYEYEVISGLGLNNSNAKFYSLYDYDNLRNTAIGDHTNSCMQAVDTVIMAYNPTFGTMTEWQITIPNVPPGTPPLMYTYTSLNASEVAAYAAEHPHPTIPDLKDLTAIGYSCVDGTGSPATSADELISGEELIVSEGMGIWYYNGHIFTYYTDEEELSGIIETIISFDCTPHETNIPTGTSDPEAWEYYDVTDKIYMEYDFAKNKSIKYTNGTNNAIAVESELTSIELPEEYSFWIDKFNKTCDSHIHSVWKTNTTGGYIADTEYKDCGGMFDFNRLSEITTAKNLTYSDFAKTIAKYPTVINPVYNKYITRPESYYSSLLMTPDTGSDYAIDISAISFINDNTSNWTVKIKYDRSVYTQFDEDAKEVVASSETTEVTVPPSSISVIDLPNGDKYWTIPNTRVYLSPSELGVYPEEEGFFDNVSFSVIIENNSTDENFVKYVYTGNVKITYPIAVGGFYNRTAGFYIVDVASVYSTELLGPNATWHDFSIDVWAKTYDESIIGSNTDLSVCIYDSYGVVDGDVACVDIIDEHGNKLDAKIYNLVGTNDTFKLDKWTKFTFRTNEDIRVYCPDRDMYTTDENDCMYKFINKHNSGKAIMDHAQMRSFDRSDLSEYDSLNEFFAYDTMGDLYVIRTNSNYHSEETGDFELYSW